LFIYTRCHSCKNQIVKDRSQQASTAASSVALRPVNQQTRSRFRRVVFSMDRGGIHALGKAEVRHWPLYPTNGLWPWCPPVASFYDRLGGKPPSSVPKLGHFAANLVSQLTGGETGNLTRPGVYVKGCSPAVFLTSLVRTKSTLGLSFCTRF
jgi:hypothetical protein